MNTIIQNVQVKAIASWLPTNNVEMTSFFDLYGMSEVQSISKATGIERVRIADGNTTSADMCQKAAEHLFEQKAIERNEIDGLVFISQTCDYILPATAISLQHRLGLSDETICLDVHYGCSGYIYGLFTAATWINSGMCSNVLVLAGDTTSRMINQYDKSLRMVFGDCGTASIITKGDNPMGFYIKSDGSGADRLIVPAGGFRLPISAETSVIEYDEDNNGRTKNDLYMDGAAIFNFAVSHVHENINSLLANVGWKKESVGLFALHQANKFMVNYIRKRLKVGAELVPTNVLNYGNTGPSSIPLLLSDICPKGKYDLSRVVMSGFGVGLSWGSITTDMSKTIFYEPLNK